MGVLRIDAVVGARALRWLVEPEIDRLGLARLRGRIALRRHVQRRARCQRHSQCCAHRHRLPADRPLRRRAAGRKAEHHIILALRQDRELHVRGRGAAPLGGLGRDLGLLDRGDRRRRTPHDHISWLAQRHDDVERLHRRILPRIAHSDLHPALGDPGKVELDVLGRRRVLAIHGDLHVIGRASATQVHDHHGLFGHGRRSCSRIAPGRRRARQAIGISRAVEEPRPQLYRRPTRIENGQHEIAGNAVIRPDADKEIAGPRRDGEIVQSRRRDEEADFRQIEPGPALVEPELRQHVRRRRGIGEVEDRRAEPEAERLARADEGIGRVHAHHLGHGEIARIVEPAGPDRKQLRHEWRRPVLLGPLSQLHLYARQDEADARLVRIGDQYAGRIELRPAQAGHHQRRPLEQQVEREGRARGIGSEAIDRRRIDGVEHRSTRREGIVAGKPCHRIVDHRRGVARRRQAELDLVVGEFDEGCSSRRLAARMALLVAGIAAEAEAARQRIEERRVDADVAAILRPTAQHDAVLGKGDLVFMNIDDREDGVERSNRLAAQDIRSNEVE
ncbi:hypothetical protein [Devosia sp. DBB001]|nr:hypothetical protein [Devosia sp. DBB001]